MATYGQKYADVRQYVTKKLNVKKLSKSDKSYITRAWGEVYGKHGLATREHVVVTAKSSEKLKALQYFAGHVPGKIRLKVAFVPVADGTVKTRVKATKKNGEWSITVSDRYATRTIHLFRTYEKSVKAFLENPRRVIDKILTKDAARTFGVICGKYEIAHQYLAMDLADQIDKLVAKYANAGEWLHGVASYRYTNQHGRTKVAVLKERARLELQKRLRKLRKKRR